MIRAAAIAAVVVLAGCDAPRLPQPDQELRAKIFKECLSAIPKGPERTVYNDWSEVVEACENAAYYQSLRPVGGAK